MFDYNNLFYFQNNTVEKIELTLMNLVEVSSKSGVYLLLGFVFGNILNRILPAYVETKERRDYIIEVFLTGALMGLLAFLYIIIMNTKPKDKFRLQMMLYSVVSSLGFIT